VQFEQPVNLIPQLLQALSRLLDALLPLLLDLPVQHLQLSVHPPEFLLVFLLAGRVELLHFGPEVLHLGVELDLEGHQRVVDALGLGKDELL
jgi:hypothetical protein